jgi:aspartate dehydrogenase
MTSGMMDAPRRRDNEPAAIAGPLRVALIGHGAIGAVLARLLREPDAGVDIVAILARDARSANDAQCFITAPDDLIAARPDLVVECAGHDALRRHGVTVLSAGIDLMLVSAGALVDAALHRDLCAAARRAGATIEIPGGAIGGVAALAAARLAGLSLVRHTVIKPPQAWRGTLAETLIRLDGLDEACTFFDGTARDAAASYPQNANVSATGAGWSRLRAYAGAAGRRPASAREQPSGRGVRRVRRTAPDDRQPGACGKSENLEPDRIQCRPGGAAPYRDDPPVTRGPG